MQSDIKNNIQSDIRKTTQSSIEKNVGTDIGNKIWNNKGTKIGNNKENTKGKNIEKHPLEPFLPANAKILMLGSFPPKKDKWSMEFFYPNWINDMWRIVGEVFFSDKEHFISAGQKKFDKEKIEAFCKEKGIALYDTASEVIRLKDNASDKFLEIVTPSDLGHILSMIPECKAIVTTGQKATDVIVETFGCDEPPVGGMTELNMQRDAKSAGRDMKKKGILHFWRMPSSSRAYPLKLENKAAFYKVMFETEGLVK